MVLHLMDHCRPDCPCSNSRSKMLVRPSASKPRVCPVEGDRKQYMEEASQRNPPPMHRVRQLMKCAVEGCNRRFASLVSRRFHINSYHGISPRPGSFQGSAKWRVSLSSRRAAQAIAREPQPRPAPGPDAGTALRRQVLRAAHRCGHDRELRHPCPLEPGGMSGQPDGKSMPPSHSCWTRARSRSAARYAKPCADVQNREAYTREDLDAGAKRRGLLFQGYDTGARQERAIQECMRMQGKQKLWLCPFADCDKNFTKLSGFRIHWRRHTGEKPWVCPVVECRRRCVTKGALAVHVQTHTGEKPWVCPVPGCGERFSQKVRIGFHLRVHSGAKPYHCTFERCGRGFSRADGLKVHLRHHRGQTPYACAFENCGKRFARASCARRHAGLHLRKARHAPAPQALRPAPQPVPASGQLSVRTTAVALVFAHQPVAPAPLGVNARPESADSQSLVMSENVRPWLVHPGSLTPGLIWDHASGRGVDAPSFLDWLGAILKQASAREEATLFPTAETAETAAPPGPAEESSPSLLHPVENVAVPDRLSALSWLSPFSRDETLFWQWLPVIEEPDGSYPAAGSFGNAGSR